VAEICDGVLPSLSPTPCTTSYLSCPPPIPACPPRRPSPQAASPSARASHPPAAPCGPALLNSSALRSPPPVNDPPGTGPAAWHDHSPPCPGCACLGAAPAPVPSITARGSAGVSVGRRLLAAAPTKRCRIATNQVRVQRRKKSRIVTVGFRVGDRSRGRFATPADFLRHGCSPYSHAHVRRDSLGVFTSSKGHFLSARAGSNPFSSDSHLFLVELGDLLGGRCAVHAQRGVVVDFLVEGAHLTATKKLRIVI
jgi:hypothetical protein